jgi:hypothetical protein
VADDDDQRPERPRRERRGDAPRDGARQGRSSGRPSGPRRDDWGGPRRDGGSRHSSGPSDPRRQPPRGDRGAHRDDSRPRIDAPPLPEDVRPDELDKRARLELKTLSKENADTVARHLVMAVRLIDDDPQLAHRHAVAAAATAGRIAIVRESVAITAYAIGDFALALRELRTFRRISGSDDQIALMVDSERGIGRPDRALELGRSVDRGALPIEAQVGLAIAMSGARLDQGETAAALDELERAPVDLARVHPWSPELYGAFAAVHEELGNPAEAARWETRAANAAAVLDEVDAESSSIEITTETDPEDG